MAERRAGMLVDAHEMYATRRCDRTAPLTHRQCQDFRSEVRSKIEHQLRFVISLEAVAKPELLSHLLEISAAAKLREQEIGVAGRFLPSPLDM